MENHARSNKLISQLMQNLTLYSENNDNFQSTNDYIQNVQKKKRNLHFKRNTRMQKFSFKSDYHFRRSCASRRSSKASFVHFSERKGEEKEIISVSNFTHPSFQTLYTCH